jgi:hypothetical protein
MIEGAYRNSITIENGAAAMIAAVVGNHSSSGDSAERSAAGLAADRR